MLWNVPLIIISLVAILSQALTQNFAHVVRAKELAQQCPESWL